MLSQAAPLLHQLLASPLYLAVAGFAVLVFIAGALLGRAGSDFPYIAAPALLTPAERSFFFVLRQAIGEEYALFAKVRLADVIDIKKGVTGKRRMAAFGRIKAKHADFVLCDQRTFVIVGVIELDDRSHRLPARQRRDEFFDAALEAAAMPLVRVPAQRTYSVATLRTLVHDALSEKRPR